MQVTLFDTTLRDGAQTEGISFSLEDKLKIAKLLDELGVHYIEGGWPGSNPKDIEFFKAIKDISLKNAKIVAFSSTRRPNVKVEADKNIETLLAAETPAVSIFGKCWDFHVTDALKTTLEENLAMIKEMHEVIVQIADTAHQQQMSLSKYIEVKEDYFAPKKKKKRS